VTRSLEGNGAALAQRTFPGEGVMIEVIFAAATIQLTSALVAAGSGGDTGR